MDLPPSAPLPSALKNRCFCTLLLLLATLSWRLGHAERKSPPLAPDPTPLPSERTPSPASQSTASAVIEITQHVTPGSETVISEKELERFEQDDIHKVLSAVPGIYFREEDGYGLRPNIGMRGSNPERSAKIALTEDGVLIAPAPYSAPAAYYFPMITRMRSIEVLKGPSAIVYGPNTVSGSINFLSREIPAETSGAVDLARGTRHYGKAHGYVGTSSDHFGVLLEGVKIRSNGFKVLDGGGNTGFDKNDISLALRATTHAEAEVYHQSTLKIGYSDEQSNETYTGLSDADFANTPYRRYRATHLDKMSWDHLRWQLSHDVNYNAEFDISTNIYRNSFARAWFKLDAFAEGAPLIGAILANPEASNHRIFYQLLTGKRNSTSPRETLYLTNNDREFFSQGIQTLAHTERSGLGLQHNLKLGLRFHQDQALRLSSVHRFVMSSGHLLRTDEPAELVRDATGETTALAAFVSDEITAGRLSANLGLRTELIATRWQDRLDPSQNQNNSQHILIPGAGLYYQLTDALGLLAGVHRGFVPVAPGSDSNIRPELSLNYEAGARAHALGMNAEVIGFVSDYSNLKGTCTLSSGCQSTQVGNEFNGGKVLTLGLETLLSLELEIGWGLRVPLRANYTFTRSEFRQRFTSANPQWGDVEKGDHLPYLPSHQLMLQGALGDRRWELAAAARYQSRVRDRAGQETSETMVAGYATIDLAAHVYFGRWGQLYATADNITGTTNIVSRRPLGARPGKARLFIAGYKAKF